MLRGSVGRIRAVWKGWTSAHCRSPVSLLLALLPCPLSAGVHCGWLEELLCHKNITNIPAGCSLVAAFSHQHPFPGLIS